MAQQDAGYNALTQLTRLAQRSPHGRRLLEQALVGHLSALIDTALEVAITTGDPIGEVLTDAVQQAATTELIESLEDSLEMERYRASIPLRELALVVTEKRIARALKEDFSPIQKKSMMAELKLKLAFRLSAVGRREEAAESIKEATTIFRQLAMEQPKTFRAELAMALSNQAKQLGDLSHQQPALQAAEEAVELYRQLVRDRPKEFQSAFALALEDLGIRLATFERWEEALQALKEAVELGLSLARENPALGLPTLARSLSSLSMAFLNLGHLAEAAKAIAEAVVLFRELAEARPEEFLPALGASLDNWGEVLHSLGHHEAALQKAHEATELRYQLAGARPDVFLPDLANSLLNLGTRLSLLYRFEEGLHAVQEAVNLHRQLTRSCPGVFYPELAKSLSRLSNHLRDLHLFEEALKATQETVAIRRQLAHDEPVSWRAPLANSLSNLGIRYSDLQRLEEAKAAFQEAIALFRELAQDRPEVFLPDLANCLTNLCPVLAGLGHQAEALAVIEESIAIVRSLSEKATQEFQPDLATALHNRGALLAKMGDVPTAFVATREVVTLRRQLAREHPGAFRHELATSLDNLFAITSELGESEEAEQALRESLELYEQLAAADPETFRFEVDTRRELVEELAARAKGLASLGSAEFAPEGAERYRRDWRTRGLEKSFDLLITAPDRFATERELAAGRRARHVEVAVARARGALLQIANPPFLRAPVGRLWQLPAEFLDARGKTGNTALRLPPPPALFLGRAADLRFLKTGLCRSLGEGIERGPLLLVTGWPGIGKTTMTTALANDPELQKAFPDGILWAALDQSPNLLTELSVWCVALGGPGPSPTDSIEEASLQLARLLRHRRVLLLLDDVWEPTHALPFLVGGPRCAMLATSRLDAVAEELAPTSGAIYRLPLLSEEAGLELLRSHAPQVVAEYRDECRILVRELEGLPLSLYVAGRMLAEESRLWRPAELLETLSAGRNLLSQKAPQDRAYLRREALPTLSTLLAKSTERLPPEIFERFAFLGVLAPKPATFDLAALRALWDVEDPKPTVRSLINLGLLEATGYGSFRMHALLVAHAESLLED